MVLPSQKQHHLCVATIEAVTLKFVLDSKKACSMSPSEKSSKTAVPVLTDISINRMDAGPKQATENVLQLKIHMTKSLKGSTAKQQK